MKQKIDFVTNSSSSSFVVAFDKPIESLDEVKGKVMFIEKAEVVFRDIQKQKPLRVVKDCPPCLKKITEEIASGYFPGYTSDFEESREIRRENFPSDKEYFKAMDELFKKYSKINKKKASEIASKFIEENQGKVVYFFSYSDEDGEFWSQMEHGGTFDNFPHVTISHH